MHRSAFKISATSRQNVSHFHGFKSKIQCFFKQFSKIAELNDLCKLLNAIQTDSRLGFSVVSFVRQAITLREKWMGDACVRGRLCNTPGHWGRNLIRFPPCAEELPLDFEQAFWKGWPWIFSNESPWFSNDE